MIRNRKRNSDASINEAQAELWRRQTQFDPVPCDCSPVQQDNPWIRNLPYRRPRRSWKGVVIFFVLIAVMLAATAIYGVYVSETDPTDSAGISIGEDEPNITIQTMKAEENIRLTVKTERGEELSAPEIYKKVNPAVVAVVSVHGDETMSLGTGVIFDQSGYFLTNAHVIDDSDSCMVLLADGRRYPAALIGYDIERDVAVLKALNVDNLPTAEIGDSESLEVGETVYAIGNPLGLELRGTLTNGIVSAINRDVRVDGRSMTLIQTNAAINEGNSGGPLINSFGQVVGLNVVKMSASQGKTTVEGLGFAIPSRIVEYLTNQIIEYGEPLPETSMGILVIPGGEEDAPGIEVYEVEPFSCSQKAGLEIGDIIIAADGIPTPDTISLLTVRRSHRPGEEMVLTVLRQNEKMEITVILDAAQ